MLNVNVFFQALLCGVFLLACEQKEPDRFVFYPNSSKGKVSPVEVVRAFCQAIEKRDRLGFLDLMAWCTFDESSQHESFFFSEAEFEAYVKKNDYVRRQVEDVKASYQRVKMFERGIKQLGEDLKASLAKGVLPIEKSKDRFLYRYALSNPYMDVTEAEIQIRNINGSWYIWDFG